MTTLALIPARGGSRGLPGKNLARVGGRTLIQRAVDVARAVNRIELIVVSSDATEILWEAERTGALVDRRPASLATDTTPTSAVVEHVLARWAETSVIVLLQPTSPLRLPEDVEACLDAIRNAPAAATVVELDHPPAWIFEKDEEGRLQPLPGGDWRSMTTRRQDARRAFALNGAVYAAQTEFLRSGGPLIGPRTVGVTMPPERSIDIDTATDLQIANCLASGDG